MFMLNRKKRRKVELEKVEKHAQEVHASNIKSIRSARQNADTLNVVLKENCITLKLARAMGHKS